MLRMTERDIQDNERNAQDGKRYAQGDKCNAWDDERHARRRQTVMVKTLL